MSVEPYKEGMIKKDAFFEKRAIIGELIAVSDINLKSRGLKLIAPWTRAVLKNEIHELILTDEPDVKPSREVVKVGGIIMVADNIRIGNEVIGYVAGFDETHMPNHMNIVIKAVGDINDILIKSRKLGSKVVFEKIRAD
jgi:hypothetical protein